MGLGVAVGAGVGVGVAVGEDAGVCLGVGVAVGAGVAVGDGVGVAVGAGVGVGLVPAFRTTACPLMVRFVGVCGGVPLKVNPMETLPPLAPRVEVQLAGVRV